MPDFTAASPGKIILVGEHAVVYGEPALALPVQAVKARAVISPLLDSPEGRIFLEAPDVGLSSRLEDLRENHPLRVIVSGLQQELNLQRFPSCRIKITSTIPIASGLGSGAAVSTAVARALSGFVGHPLDLEQLSALTYEVEKIHHGTPSGIDNTVVVYEKPIFFTKDKTFQTIRIPVPFTLVIGSSGIQGPTIKSVERVRDGWKADPLRYETIFAFIGDISRQTRRLIESGSPLDIGPLLDENHRLLQKLDVSIPELDHLVQSAKSAGALGAKLSGAGLGGNMIALADDKNGENIKQALFKAGAEQVFSTTIPATEAN
jgi:mevalonate kinase